MCYILFDVLFVRYVFLFFDPFRARLHTDSHSFTCTHVNNFLVETLLQRSQQIKHYHDIQIFGTSNYLFEGKQVYVLLVLLANFEAKIARNE